MQRSLFQRLTSHLFNTIGICITLVFLSACGNEVFSPSRTQINNQAQPRSTFSQSACAQFTHIKPKVDFLFVWDNSSGTNFINDDTKYALNNTIDLISNRFDYNILVAPLIKESHWSTSQHAFLISENPDGLDQNVLDHMQVDRSLAAHKMANLPQVGGSESHGVKRTVELLKDNQNNGVFRENAYTMIVLMSNDNDSYHFDESSTGDPIKRSEYIEEYKNELLCLRGSYNGNCSGITSLNSEQLRFMSIVRQDSNPSNCSNVSLGRVGDVYMEMSNLIYHADYTGDKSRPNDQFGNSTPDSYDICNRSDFSRIFDGINNSIQDQVVKHKYDYWPVASPGAPDFSANEIEVKKIIAPYNNEVSFDQLDSPPQNGESGFIFEDQIQTVDTRYAPTPGEPFTGYVIKLFGDAKVTYPECLKVTTITPLEWYGYVHLHSKPQADTIQLTIDGKDIEQSSSNGWTLITDNGGNPKYINDQNIMIKSKNDDSPKTPGMKKSGYFLKLHGDAVHSNGAKVEVNYIPDGT